MKPQIKDFDTKFARKESHTHILDSDESEDDLDCKIAAQLQQLPKNMLKLVETSLGH